ncbi:hypothetical protein KL918_004615 [Ogataea parapolymorpha]|nr:hypothetical protein KL918_004615 [Ogataea parapolymorpha]KAG7873818.1 hypothetical protein KL916_001978 [Ogataea parapolymorpha]
MNTDGLLCHTSLRWSRRFSSTRSMSDWSRSSSLSLAAQVPRSAVLCSVWRTAITSSNTSSLRYASTIGSSSGILGLSGPCRPSPPTYCCFGELSNRSVSWSIAMQD